MSSPTPAPPLPGLAAGQNATIVLERVSKWYGDVVAVSDVSFGVPPGVTGLLGPNGAGKSTIIHMMGGFLAPSNGTVQLDGEDVWRNEAMGRPARDVAPLQEHAAGCDGHEARHRLDERRFAGPVRAEHGDDFVGLHGE